MSNPKDTDVPIKKEKLVLSLNNNKVNITSDIVKKAFNQIERKSAPFQPSQSPSSSYQIPNSTNLTSDEYKLRLEKVLENDNRKKESFINNKIAAPAPSVAEGTPLSSLVTLEEAIIDIVTDEPENIRLEPIEPIIPVIETNEPMLKKKEVEEKWEEETFAKKKEGAKKNANHLSKILDKYGVEKLLVEELANNTIPENEDDDVPMDTQEYDMLYGGSISVKSTDHQIVIPKKKKRFADQGIKKPILNTYTEKKVVELPENITVDELAKRMSLKAAAVIKSLMKMGVMATINQTIDSDTAELVLLEYGHQAKKIANNSPEDIIAEIFNKTDSSFAPRGPIVTVMGHVDHGKTSLLDAIKNTNIAARESGGITQHIGAYTVNIDGRTITFIDTPGHQAFSEMRSRGANVTDIVVLVVAGDDGVMPQTIEAIEQAQKANAPIIVAVNKIDKPGINLQHIKNELMRYGIMPEEVGGNNIFVEVSAKQKLNIDKLLEMILLQADVMELKASSEGASYGVVLEARSSAEKGINSTLLIQGGTLKIGDIITAGVAYGKIKNIKDSAGKRIEHVGPSIAVEVQGLNTTPRAGDKFIAVDSEKKARDMAEYFTNKAQTGRLSLQNNRPGLDKIFSTESNKKELAVIVKTDVSGSIDPIVGLLNKIIHPKVGVKVIQTGVGMVTESDAHIAQISDAVIIAFNVKTDSRASTIRDQNNLKILNHSIIYEVEDEIKQLLSDLLPPIVKEVYQGKCEVRQIFRNSSIGTIAGCLVTDGTIHRNATIKLIRKGTVIATTAIGAIRRFKDEVKEVKSGYECGISLKDFDGEIMVGDVMDAYSIVEEKQYI